jgi:hypothetical protein
MDRRTVLCITMCNGSGRRGACHPIRLLEPGHTASVRALGHLLLRSRTESLVHLVKLRSHVTRFEFGETHPTLKLQSVGVCHRPLFEATNHLNDRHMGGPSRWAWAKERELGATALDRGSGQLSCRCTQEIALPWARGCASKTVSRGSESCNRSGQGGGLMHMCPCTRPHFGLPFLTFLFLLHHRNLVSNGTCGLVSPLSRC